MVEKIYILKCVFSYELLGNLTSRTGMLSQSEFFGYDNVDRLKTVNLNSSSGTLAMSTNYLSNGNIQDKKDLGTYTYHSTKKHAVTQVDNTGSILNAHKQVVTYNAFNKVSQIKDTLVNDAYQLNITYGPDQQRWKTVLSKNNSTTKTIIFANNYEKVTENGVTKEMIYLPGGCIYVVQSGQTSKMYFAHSDHLGSIVKITEKDGTQAFKAEYDAWGKQTITNSTFKFHRGYTGHEHLPEFELINMNGRMYDYNLGRFLSPDSYVQNPYMSQNYNRYSYCLNNPLRYTDPTGEKLKWWQWALIGLGIADPLTTFTTVSATATAAGASVAGAAATTVLTALPKMFNSYIAGIFGGDKYPENRAKNAWKISAGLMKTDKDKNFLNRTWQIMSRHTLQQPFTIIGYEVANLYNNYTQLDDIGYFHGATVLIDNNMSSAVSLGGYIIMNPSYGGINYDNTTLLHEYGHFLQTRQWGGIASITPSIFSGLSAGLDWRRIKNHGDIWVERDANARALSYFRNKLDATQVRNFVDEYPCQYADDTFFHRCFFPNFFAFFLYEDINFSY